MDTFFPLLNDVIRNLFRGNIGFVSIRDMLKFRLFEYIVIDKCNFLTIDNLHQVLNLIRINLIVQLTQQCKIVPSAAFHTLTIDAVAQGRAEPAAAGQSPG